MANQGLEQAVDCLADVRLSHLFLYGFSKWEAGRIDGVDMGKASLEQEVTVADAAGKQCYGSAPGMAEDTRRHLSHQRLAVGTAFAGDDDVGP